MNNSDNRELLNGVSRAAMNAANADEAAKTAKPIPIEPIPMSPSREAYSLSETAMKLGGVSPASLYRWRAKGLIRFIKVGSRTLVPASEIARLTAGQSAA